jgi:hypothetical protein
MLQLRKLSNVNQQQQRIGNDIPMNVIENNSNNNNNSSYPYQQQHSPLEKNVRENGFLLEQQSYNIQL